MPVVRCSECSVAQYTARRYTSPARCVTCDALLVEAKSPWPRAVTARHSREAAPGLAHLVDWLDDRTDGRGAEPLLRERHT